MATQDNTQQQQAMSAHEVHEQLVGQAPTVASLAAEVALHRDLITQIVRMIESGDIPSLTRGMSTREQ
jgi:hypothetical protein